MKKAICIFVTFGLWSPGPAAHAAAGVVVTHHETLESFEIDAGAAGLEKPAAAVGVTLSFDGLGRRFALELEPNDRLLSAAARRNLDPGVAVYRGRMAGVADSWVRIVVADGMPRGVIWDGSELLAIEAPGDSAVQTSVPVIYRLKDTYVVPGSMSCGTEKSAGSAAAAYGKLVGELETAMAQGPGASMQLDLGAVGDFELFRHFSSNAATTEAAILTRLNTVDGIYSEQLGVQISVEELEVFTTAADPFSDQTNAGVLLDEVGVYRQNSPAQRVQGLTHLYTGRNLDTTTVGIAYLDALCSIRFGAGLSEAARQGAMTASLIAAHEIGHNFGAEHDAEAGSVCESAPAGFLMEASVNGNDQFSQCSLDTITPRIAAATCINPLPTVDMSIDLDGSLSAVLLGANATLSFTAGNAGTQSATGVAVDIDLPTNVSFVSAATEFGTCTSGAGTVNCTYGTVPGNSSRTVTLTTLATDVGNGTFTATVTADTDVDPTNNDETVTLTVDPAVDLVVNAIAAAQIDLDETIAVTVDLENRSILDASGVGLSISFGNNLRADDASWPPGSCTVTDQQVDCSTANFAGQSDATLDLVLTGTANGPSSYTVSLSSAEDEAVPTNNSVTATVQVGPVTMSGGSGSSGGGGAWGPLYLFLVGSWAAIGAARRRTDVDSPEPRRSNHSAV